MDEKCKPIVDAERIALEGMSPKELNLEFTRLTGELPGKTLTREELIERAIAGLRKKL